MGSAVSNDNLKQITLDAICPGGHEPLEMPAGETAPLETLISWTGPSGDELRAIEMRVCKKCGLLYARWTPNLEEAAPSEAREMPSTVGKVYSW